MSFQSRLSPKARRVARMIRAARENLVHAFEAEKDKKGFTQAQLAREMNLDRSVINRRLMGRENLTIRTLAELADALDRELRVDFLERKSQHSQNEFRIETSDGVVTRKPMTVTVSTQSANAPRGIVQNGPTNETVKFLNSSTAGNEYSRLGKLESA